ncbi:hypothetical protein, partial [Escherichia coli]|uniref:hypothetical protein n=1 Tax=Escherichia coli TaxID=562 RepID=UPI0022848582
MKQRPCLLAGDCLNAIRANAKANPVRVLLNSLRLTRRQHPRICSGADGYACIRGWYAVFTGR